MCFAEGFCQREKMMPVQNFLVDIRFDITGKTVNNLLHDVAHCLLMKPLGKRVYRHYPAVGCRITGHDSSNIFFSRNPLDLRVMNFPMIAELIHFTGEYPSSPRMPGFLHPDGIEVEPFKRHRRGSITDDNLILLSPPLVDETVAEARQPQRLPYAPGGEPGDLHAVRAGPRNGLGEGKSVANSLDVETLKSSTSFGPTPLTVCSTWEKIF